MARTIDMFGKPRITILLAICFGLLASAAIYRYLLRYDDMVEAQEIVTRPVVVAARDVPFGSELSPDDLSLTHWPAEIAPKAHFTVVDSVIGRINRSPLIVGEAVLESRLAPVGSDRGLAMLIPEGSRAMTVPVNVVSGVSGFVLPGSRVDVLVSIRPRSNREPMAKMILQNVRVLAVDQQMEERDGRPITSRAVTLEVGPEEAEKLGLASTEGTLLLALRSSIDSGVNATAGATVSKLLGSGKPKVRKVVKRNPAPPPDPGVEVEVIRGTERTAEKLKN
jgi:pilus assembly protein CpaB